MLIDVLTIFPDVVDAVIGESILKRAQEKNLVSVRTWDLRNWSPDKHRKVDDKPFGGGSGMVMRPEPFFLALEEILKDTEQVWRVFLSPGGVVFNQSKAYELSNRKHLCLLCGHYEGVDERVRQYLVDEEVSLGDYILTGGEIAACVLIDSVVRLIPGVLGDEDSLREESFAEQHAILEYPHYTRPADFRGMKVPDVLLSGDHQKIEKWRKEQALSRTKQRRPDLLSG